MIELAAHKMDPVSIPAPVAGLQWQCPSCGSPCICGICRDSLQCTVCGLIVVQSCGIWRALRPDRLEYFHTFMRDYEHIRASEGRGSTLPDYYRALPFVDITGRNAWQWKIRAHTYRHLERHVLPRIEREKGSSLVVLDIGAGNGWLSYRLALRGHSAVALDLLDNDSDGLGSARHYGDVVPSPITLVQAEMDRLPFESRQFDVVIFNASFHYSEDYRRTLREALRCLRPEGHLLILDSPFYRDSRAGLQMLAERHAQFRRQYGFASDSINSSEFLTYAAWKSLEREFGLESQIMTPWYGWQWALRPWKALVKRRREPSKFHIVWARPKA